MKRFINFYDEQMCYICGRSYYFDQRLSNRTMIECEADKYAKQVQAHESNPEKFFHPDGRYMRIFAGERFDESNPLTELIDFKR